MFVIYKSNQLDILFSKIYQITKKKTIHTPFAKELFIHDEKILFTWLNMFIAKKDGISANFQFYYIHNFIWKIFQILIPQKKNIYTYNILLMTWNIMNIIEKKKYSEYINIQDKQIKKFKFSFLMANIFEEYLLYRPKWIDIWENNNILNIKENQKWQIKLWKNLNLSTEKEYPFSYHYVHILNIIKKMIHEKNKNIYNLPTRCFIMSSFSLNPMYIKILEILGKHINIYLLYMTPCKKNIFFSIAKQKNNIVPKKNILDNSLMMLWGQYEKIYSFYINNKKTKIIHCFQKITSINLLNMIQNNILQNRNNNLPFKKKILSSTEDSISINVCQNQKHEIEILYTKLLNIFQENPTISPGEIIIVSTKMNEYISFINSIFKSESNKYCIPFFINEEDTKKRNILFSSFYKILNLSTSRCNNQEILELLEIPEIAKKFNISEDEIELLYYWIKKINIRWGIDDNHQEKLFSIKNKRNTWLYGIEKLLLNYSINQENAIWNNYISCLSIHESQIETIGKIADFIHIINKWRKKLSIPKTFKSWYLLFSHLIKDFFGKDILLRKNINLIKNYWEEITYNGIISQYKKKISIDIIKIYFIKIINTIKHKKFLPGVINFCHPQSVYYIPFKVICMIGMNEQNFPRKEKILDINLLHQYKKIGDKNKRLQDFYLFLQSLTSAKRYFYISYIKYSVQYNCKIYPSILLDQLTYYISSNFCFIEDQFLSIENNHKKIINYFYKNHQYDYLYKKIENIKNCSSISYHNNIYHIDIQDLINFWKNPIRYFFKNKLKINLTSTNKEIITTEPFSLDTLDYFKIKKNILKKMITCKNIEELFQYYKLSGMLPYGYFGKIFWEKTVNEMQKIANVISTFRINTTQKKIRLNIKKYYLYGTLNEIQDTGLLRWKPNRINHSDKMSLWIEHLIYCSLEENKESRIIGSHNQIWCFSSLPSHLAQKYLLHYILEYVKGIHKPLILLKSGASWLNYVYDIDKKYITNDKLKRKKGYLKLLDIWNGSNYYEGEKKDLYVKNIILELNHYYIRKICAISKKWLLPILQYKKHKNKS